jgi:hypothetical protein
METKELSPSQCQLLGDQEDLIKNQVDAYVEMTLDFRFSDRVDSEGTFDAIQEISALARKALYTSIDQSLAEIAVNLEGKE